ncbi:hypothetical protein QQF64_020199 [Cirrhinus molitorella]|uniref:Transposase n=1 Tax=Cirrhinus molitorella TaxID=172907 RepID=A0ABR3LBX5_9TELE
MSGILTSTEVEEEVLGLTREVWVNVVEDKTIDLDTGSNSKGVETRPNRGGRSKILADQQEQAVVNMVRVRNDIRLAEIRHHILDNDDVFRNVEAISLSTIARVLKINQVSLKQLYHVPFERNTDRVKQSVIELDADDNHHKFLFLDEAGFEAGELYQKMKWLDADLVLGHIMQLSS